MPYPRSKCFRYFAIFVRKQSSWLHKRETTTLYSCRPWQSSRSRTFIWIVHWFDQQLHKTISVISPQFNERRWRNSSNTLFCSLFGLENFCRDMEYFNEDNLNSLIRWAVYAYGYEFDDCLNTNYTQLIGRLADTDWETSAYPRCNIFQLKHSIPTENNSIIFSTGVCLSSMHTNSSF